VAPEILKNLAYGTKVDMWALGVIQYTLIGGIPPFYAASNQETFQKILKAKIEFPDELWGHVSQDCKDMIQGYVQDTEHVYWLFIENIDFSNIPWISHPHILFVFSFSFY